LPAITFETAIVVALLLHCVDQAGVEID